MFLPEKNFRLIREGWGGEGYTLISPDCALVQDNLRPLLSVSTVNHHHLNCLSLIIARKSQ